MKIVDWPQFLREKNDYKATALSIGVFDGVHKGHQSLIQAIREKSALVPAVCTFSGNPQLIFSPQRFLGDITTVTQKIALLRSLGIQLLILIDFSFDFSKLSGREFLDLLLEKNKPRYLALGENFRFGFQADTSSQDAKKLLSGEGIDVDILPPVTYKGMPISSTRIRKALKQGSLEEAEFMMGRPFALDVNHALQSFADGRSSVNKNSIKQVYPPPGEYPCRRVYEGIDNSVELKENTAVFITDKTIEWTQQKVEHTRYIEFSRG